jgi:dethiobiotin synthetase
MSYKGIFITGTDTGVGKTYIAAGIASALRQWGVDVGVMKPAETGCIRREGKLIPRDALRLMKAAAVADHLDLVNPYRFPKPLAPSVAAELDARTINPEKIIDAYRKLSPRHDFMIVEGAGGIMVPLWGAYTYLDLARALDLPVVIVARPGLGTVNHTLLTIAALKERGATISGIVINYSKKQRLGIAEKTSPAVIEKISGVGILGTIPFGACDFRVIAEQLV